MSEENGHWFASSVLNWRTGTDLRKVLNQLRRDDGADMDVIIWWVPLPESANYDLRHYHPVNVGAKYISHSNLEKGGPK